MYNGFDTIVQTIIYLKQLQEMTFLKSKGRQELGQIIKKSRFCSKKEAPQALEEIIKEVKFKYIFLSYNNEGIIPFETIKNIFEKYGKYQVFKKKYQKFRADKENAREHKADYTFEYLHCLIKN